MLDELVPVRAGNFFLSMVQRRAAGEPVQYVLGHWAFRQLDLMVDPRVLIPRPETEVVVEVALQELARLEVEGPVVVTGGIGAFSDWTLTIIRTEQGRQIIDGMIADRAIETRPGDDDPGALELLRKLARVSRKRWPATAVEAPRRIATPV